jgi:hypothetical protein
MDMETEKAITIPKFCLVSDLVDEDGEGPTRDIEPERLLVILDDMDYPTEDDLFRPWKVEGYGLPPQPNAVEIFDPKETMAELERLGMVSEFEKRRKVEWGNKEIMRGLAGAVRISTAIQKKWIHIRVIGFQAYACGFILFVNRPAQTE